MQGTTRTTEDDGSITLELTVLTNETQQTVKVEADDTSLAQSFSVTPGAYELTSSTDMLTQYLETEVTFTLKQGGILVPQDTTITLLGKGVTFDGQPEKTYVTQDASGTITAKVTASLADISIKASMEGGDIAMASMEDSKASYLLTAQPETLKPNQPTEVVFTLQHNSGALEDVKVTLSSEGGITGLPVTAPTGSNGTFSVTLTPTDRRQQDHHGDRG